MSNTMSLTAYDILIVKRETLVYYHDFASVWLKVGEVIIYLEHSSPATVTRDYRFICQHGVVYYFTYDDLRAGEIFELL